MFQYSKLHITRVDGPDDVPAGDHWAILIFNTRTEHVEGDQRSRTNPGHGYPAHDVTHKTYQYWAVSDESTLKKSLLELEEAKKSDTYNSSKGPYVVLSVRKCAIKTEIHIEVG